MGKLNYVYSIGKCAKPLQKGLDVLSFILSLSGCYSFAFHKDLCRLPLHVRFSPAEGAGMSAIRSRSFYFSLFLGQRKNNNNFYNSELVDKQEVHYRIILLSRKKEIDSNKSDLEVRGGTEHTISKKNMYEGIRLE